MKSEASSSVADLKAEIARLKRGLEASKAELETVRSREAVLQRVMESDSAYPFCLERDSDSWFVLSKEGQEQGTELPECLSTERGEDALHEAVESRKVVSFTVPAANGSGHLKVRLEPVVLSDKVEWVLGAVEPLGRWQDLADHLRGVARRHGHLIDLLPEAVSIVRADHSIAYLNSSGSELLGAESPESLIGKNAWQFVHPDDVSLVLQHIESGRQRESVRYRVRRLDGVERTVETVMVPIDLDGEPAMLSTARDLTDRQQLKQALTQTKNLFYHVFQSVPAGLVLFRKSDGVCVDVNTAFQKMTGEPREDLVGQPVEGAEGWQKNAEIASLLTGDAGTQREGPVQIHVAGSGGVCRVVMATVQNFKLQAEPHALCVLLDISDLKQTRTRLQRISKAVESTSEAILLLDPDGQVTYLNDAFDRLIGFSADQLNREPGVLSIVTDEEQRNELRVAMEAGTSWRGDVRVRASSHEEIPVALRADAVRNELGEVIGLVWICTDISERRAVEQQLLKAKTRAEEMARLKTAILTNITHEVRTPLTVILGFTSMLRKGTRPRYERFVDLIERSGRRLLLTLDSMLDLAQIEAGKLEIVPESVNLVEIIKDVQRQLRPTAEEKEVALRLEVHADPITVLQDHRMLRRVLHNLLDNALKFTHEGCVCVELWPEAEGYVRLQVQDTGIGIDESFLDHVFDEFVQESTGMERSYQGSGIGLTVSRRLIERLHGSIDVSSEKGKGTTFEIRIPVDVQVFEANK